MMHFNSQFKLCNFEADKKSIMKRYLTLLFCCVFLISINAQKKNISSKIAAPKLIVSEIVNKAQLDSTASFTIYTNQRFLSFNNNGSFSSADSLGKLYWKQNVAGSILVHPTVTGNTIVIATDNNDIYTFNLDSGEQMQSIGTEDKVTAPLFVFNYLGKKELMIPKETNSKSALVISMGNGKISCLDLETLQEYWSNTNQRDSLFTQPKLINNKIVFTRGDGSLNCIDANTGLLIWRWIGNELSNFDKSELQTDGNDIYVVSSDSILHSINFLLGRLNWSLENAKIDERFYYSYGQRNLYFIQRNEKLIIFSLENETAKDDFRLKNNLDANDYHFFEYKKKVFFIYNGVIYEATEKLLLREVLNLKSQAIKYLFNISEDTFASLTYNGELTVFRMR